jgi:hypothetical protein
MNDSTLLQKIKSTSQLMSQPTPWPKGRIPVIWVAIVSIVGFIFLIIPRASSWTVERIFAEDGQIFLTQSLENGLGGILDTYAGYLQFVPRTISLACTQVGPDNYLVCTSLTSHFIRILGMILVFPVLVRFAPNWKWALAAASSFIFIPVGQQEVLGNVSNLRGFLVPLAFFAILGVFKNPVWSVTISIVVLFSVLSDTLVIFMLPFAIWRFLSVNNWWARLPSIALGIGAVIHVVLVDTAERETRGSIWDLIDAPSQTIAQILVRGPLVTQIGMTGTQDSLWYLGVIPSVLILIVPAVLLIIAWRQRSKPDPTLLLIGLLGVVGSVVLLVTLSFPASYIALPDIWAPGQPARYSALAAMFMTPALILLIAQVWVRNPGKVLARSFAILSIGLIVLGILWDSGGDARHAAGTRWITIVEQGRQSCLDTGVDPAFTTTPDYEGWRTELTCDWLR